MAREHLRGRSRQPGDDRTFEVSEANFIQMAKRVLPDEIEVTASPSCLSRLFPGEGKAYGLRPEARILNTLNDKYFYVEVKKQGPAGNAEERGFKLFTSRFEEYLKGKLDFDYHPYCIIFCESLATLPRYTSKFPFFLRPEQYLLWKDYDSEVLKTYLMRRCRDWLDWTG